MEWDLKPTMVDGDMKAAYFVKGLSSGRGCHLPLQYRIIIGLFTVAIFGPFLARFDPIF